MHKIILPFPDWSLSGNTRTDRRYNGKARKAYRWLCEDVARKSGIILEKKKTPIALLFYPPNGNARDVDNCLSACKYGIDAVAKNFGTDDRFFRPMLIDIIKPAPPEGYIEMYIGDLKPALDRIAENEKI